MCVNTNGCVYKGINGTGQGGYDKARDEMKRLKGSSEAGIRVVNTVIQPITSVGIFSKNSKGCVKLHFAQDDFNTSYCGKKMEKY